MDFNMSVYAGLVQKKVLFDMFNDTDIIFSTQKVRNVEEIEINCAFTLHPEDLSSIYT